MNIASQILRPIRSLSPLLFCFPGFFVALTLTSCTARKGIPSDTLVVALGAAPTTLDPRFATDASGMRIAGLIFNSLVRGGKDFKPVPDAAQSWTYKNHVFTFTMRTDLKFHNNRPVNAEDIRYSFAQFLKPPSQFATTLGLIEDVQVEAPVSKPMVVKIKVKNYSDKFLLSDLPAVRILPKEETEKAGRGFAKKLIGTGGYKLARQDMNHIQLQAVTAKTKYLIFKIIRDDYTRFQKMLKGDIDIVQADMPTDKVQDFEKLNDRFKVYRYPGLSMTYLLINFKDPILKEKEVRLALDESINRSEIISHKLKNLATEATSLLTPHNSYFNPQLKNPPYNPAQAKDRIEKLNLKGRALILKTSNLPQAVDNGKVLSYQMSASGLDIQLQSFEWATFYDDIKKGNFQLATMKWVGTMDPDLYRVAFHSKEVPPGRNRGSYSNPLLDPLLEKSAETENPLNRKKIIDQVQKIVHEDMAMIPLWYDQQVAITKNNILGYEPVQTGDFTPFLNVYKQAEP